MVWDQRYGVQMRSHIEKFVSVPPNRLVCPHSLVERLDYIARHSIPASSVLNPGVTDWVPNVGRFGLFLSISRWYRLTFLSIFLLFLWSILHKIIIHQWLYSYLAFYIFQIRLENFVPTLVLFVQQLKTEKNRLEILPLFWIVVPGPL